MNSSYEKSRSAFKSSHFSSKFTLTDHRNFHILFFFSENGIKRLANFLAFIINESSFNIKLHLIYSWLMKHTKICFYLSERQFRLIIGKARKKEYRRRKNICSRNTKLFLLLLQNCLKERSKEKKHSLALFACLKVFKQETEGKTRKRIFLNIRALSLLYLRKHGKINYSISSF